MRLLIINSEYPPLGGGAANASAYLARELTNAGHEVWVLTAHFTGLEVDEVKNGVHIRRVKSWRKAMTRSGPWEQLSFIAAGLFGANKLVRNWKPDRIIAFFGVPTGVIPWVQKPFTGIPYIVSLRGGDVPGFRPYDFKIYHRLMAPIIRGVWKNASHVVANSQGLGSLGKAFKPDQVIDVIPNGVDIDEYCLPESRNWETPRMLFVGRLVYQKGLDILLEALGGLQTMEWHLDIVGDGSFKEFLEKRCQKLGIQDRVHFVGWLRGKELVDAYHRSNLFVLPSRHEGMPNAMLEAMSCGLPVIATAIAGNEELVQDGKNGLLVPAEDEIKLQDAIDSLLPRGEIRREMGASSRQIIEDGYTWERVTSAYLELLLDPRNDD